MHHHRDLRPTAVALNPAATARHVQMRRKESDADLPVTHVGHLALEALQSHVAAIQTALSIESAVLAETLTPPSSTKQLRRRKTAGAVSVARNERREIGTASRAAHGKFASPRVST